MIFKAAKNDQNHRRRLEDQIGDQYTMIIEGDEIEGTLNTHDSVLTGGNLKGQINSSGIVWILKRAKVEGNINANGVIIEGYVNGNIQCTGNAELRSSAHLQGEITCGNLAVSKGCTLEGKVEMPEGKVQTFVAKRKMFEDEFN